MGDMPALAKVGKPVWGPELPALLKLRPDTRWNRWGLRPQCLEGQEGQAGPFQKKKGGGSARGPSSPLDLEGTAKVVANSFSVSRGVPSLPSNITSLLPLSPRRATRLGDSFWRYLCGPQTPAWSLGAALTPLSFCSLAPLLQQLLMSLERPRGTWDLAQQRLQLPSSCPSTDPKFLSNHKAAQGLAYSEPGPGRCMKTSSSPSLGRS